MWWFWSERRKGSHANGKETFYSRVSKNGETQMTMTPGEH